MIESRKREFTCGAHLRQDIQDGASKVCSLNCVSKLQLLAADNQ